MLTLRLVRYHVIQIQHVYFRCVGIHLFPSESQFKGI